MADYTVFADVGTSLVKLLREQLVPEPIALPESIGLASPADKGDLQLSLFLYNITENGESRRTNMVSKGSGTLQYPPMAVDLHYLITAHSTAEIHARAIDEHRILGKMMQVFYDFSVLKPSQLTGSLSDSREDVRIVLDSLQPDVLLGFWNFNDVPYKFSVSYSIGPIFLDSNRKRDVSRVRQKEFIFADKGVEHE